MKTRWQQEGLVTNWTMKKSMVNFAACVEALNINSPSVTYILATPQHAREYVAIACVSCTVMQIADYSKMIDQKTKQSLASRRTASQQGQSLG